MLLVVLAWTACGSTGEEQPAVPSVDEASESTEKSAASEEGKPDPAPLPEPLMRQALMCCADLAMEPVMEAYLALGGALAKGDAGGISTQAAAMIAAIGRVTDAGEHLGVTAKHLKAIQGVELGEARSQYGQMSDLLVGKLETSASGELDLAVAYSREIDHHWLQEGVEPRSPYGDGIQSYSWGTREEVKAADEVREKELANPEP